MAGEKMTIDKFLEAAAAVRFRATLETSAHDAGKVKVTPWTPGGGCHCEAAIEIPKRVIAGLWPTDEVHWCCGKGLRVAEVEFVAEHTDVLHGVFAALLASNHSGPERDAVASPHLHSALQGVCQSNCARNEAACFRSAGNNPEYQLFCQQNWRNCIKNCGGGGWPPAPWPPIS
jgi:hypothetical protein